MVNMLKEMLKRPELRSADSFINPDHVYWAAKETKKVKLMYYAPQEDWYKTDIKNLAMDLYTYREMCKVLIYWYKLMTTTL